MRSLNIVLLTVIMLIPSLASAEHAIGFSAGITKGVGVTYRNINEATRMGIQVTGMPIIDEDEGFLSGGISGIYLLNKSGSGKAFITLGAGIIHAWGEEGEGLLIGFGPGAGLEFEVGENIGLSLELPIAVIFGVESSTENNVKDTEFGLKGILPIPSISLVYMW